MPLPQLLSSQILGSAKLCTEDARLYRVPSPLSLQAQRAAGGTSWNADVENVWKCTKCTTRSSCLLCVCRTLERPDQDPQLDAFSMVLSLAYLRMSDVWAKWTATFWGSGQWHCSKCCQSVILVTFRCKMGLRWACWPCWSNSKNVDGDYVAMWWYVMCHLQVMLLTYIVINSLYGASVQVLEHARTIQLWILPPSEPARHCNQLVRSQTRITNPFWWLFVFGYIYSRYPRYQWFQYFSDQSDRCTSSHP